MLMGCSSRKPWHRPQARCGGLLQRHAVRPVRSSRATATSKLFCLTNNGMGQKTNPIGLRIAVNRDWRSKWYAGKKEFGKLLSEDRQIRDLLKKKLETASVPRILIER